jgi:polar amino acid transport system substrate-binding protein
MTKSAVIAFLVMGLFSSLAHADDIKTAADRVIESGVLRCGYATSPPVLVKDANTGKISGSDYEIVQKIGEKLGLKVEWTEEVGWGNFIEGLRNNRYDMMCGSLWPDAARIKFLSLTRPVYYDRMLAYVRADDSRFNGNLDKINDPKVTIAAIDGDASYSMAQIRFPKAKILALPQMAVVADMMMSLTTKKADVIFLDPVRTAVFEKANKGQIKPVDNVDPLQVIGTSFGVKAGETHLRDMIDASLRELINDGTVAKLLAKTSKDLMPPAKDY